MPEGGGAGLCLDRLGPGLDNVEFACLAVLGPLHIHRALIMVLDRDSPAGELEDIGIVEHEGPAFLRGRLDDAGAVASALAINHAEGFATELLVDDRLVSRLCEKRLENRSEEHTSELQSLMRISYAVFLL